MCGYIVLMRGGVFVAENHLLYCGSYWIRLPPIDIQISLDNQKNIAYNK